MSTAIYTSGLRKEFSYINPSNNISTSDQWLEYLLSYITGKHKGAYGVDKRHVVAVDSLDLEVRTGEFFGLLGPNGAGKTTSIKLLSTILSPTSGEAWINGHDLMRDTDAVRASINVVRSGGWLGFDHNVSLAWNLAFWARMYGLSKAQAQARAREVLAIVGLEDKAEDGPGQLSSGQRQRLALAKGLLVYAPIMLCDEPTVALDPHSAHNVRSFLKNELNRKQGQTVVLTTHYMHEAEQLCDRIAIISAGKVVACGTVTELKRIAPARVVVAQVSGVRLGALGALQQARKEWHITDTLGPGGDGELRLLLPKDTPDEAMLSALTGICQVQGQRAEGLSLEDVFLSLTGRRFAA